MINSTLLYDRCLMRHSAIGEPIRCGKPLARWADESWRCSDGHDNWSRELRREYLGWLVRDVWIKWAREQAPPKPSWFTPWEEMNEADKEVDRRIGETLFNLGEARLHVDPRR